MSNKKSSSFLSFQAFKKKLTRRFFRLTQRSKPQSESSPHLPSADPGLSPGPAVERLPSPLSTSRYWSSRTDFVTKSQPNIHLLAGSDRPLALAPNGDENGRVTSVGLPDNNVGISSCTKFKSGSQRSVLSGYQSSVQSIPEDPDSDADNAAECVVVTDHEDNDSNHDDNGDHDNNDVHGDTNGDIDYEDKQSPRVITEEAIKWDEFVVYKVREKAPRGRGRRDKMMSGWSSLCGFLSYKPGGGEYKPGHTIMSE